MTTEELKNGKILITGATGFLGGHLVDCLRKKYGCNGNLICMGNTPDGYDLTKSEDVEELFRYRAPFDYVFNVCGWNGGIEWNRLYPSDIFIRNTLMGLNLFDACVRYKTKKIVSVLTSCAYEANDDILTEDFFLSGAPHPTVACHGYAKRNVLLAGIFAQKQYGLNAVCAIPNHIFGERENLNASRTKVLGAFVKKFVDAVETNQKEVVLWGTGEPLREFIYVKDAADLLIQTMLNYNDCYYPINIGSGIEISIKDLAEKVAKLTNYRGSIRWDTNKPDGQTRKKLDISKMERVLGKYKFTSLDDGIKNTVDYYRETLRQKALCC